MREFRSTGLRRKPSRELGAVETLGEENANLVVRFVRVPPRKLVFSYRTFKRLDGVTATLGAEPDSVKSGNVGRFVEVAIEGQNSLDAMEPHHCEMKRVSGRQARRQRYLLRSLEVLGV